MRRVFATRKAALRVNMTPMIDVVFLLIIFFLVSSHLAKQDQRTPLDLPQAVSGQAERDQRPVVTIMVLAEEGGLQLGGRLVAEESLTERIREQVLAAGEPLQVRIRADRQVPYRRVAPILKASLQAGCGDVVFAVHIPAERPAMAPSG
jgi:biopolymer transport protein ExbD